MAVGSAGMAAAMGAAAGTLTGAGQLQYVGAAAAGMLAIVLAIEPTRRARLPVLGTIAVFGTLSGTAFVPMSLASAGAFAARRRWVEAALVSTVPVGWQLLVRIVWAPALTYAPTGIDDVLRTGPAFAFTVLQTAISQTIRIPDLSGPLLVALLVGTLALLAGVGRRAVPRSRLIVGTLTLATGLSMTALIAGRLGRGVDEAGSGRYSYLFLTTLIPVSGILVGQFTRRRSVLIATAAAMLTLAIVGQFKLADDAASLSAWKQHGRALMQATAALLIHGAPAFPDQVPAPGTAPTVSQARLHSWAAAGLINASGTDPTSVDQASLNMQWRLVPTASITGACVSGSTGDQFPVPADTSLFISGSSTDTAVTIRYSTSPASRRFEIGEQAWQVESVATRPALLTIDAGELVACINH